MSNLGFYEAERRLNDFLDAGALTTDLTFLRKISDAHEYFVGTLGLADDLVEPVLEILETCIAGLHLAHAGLRIRHDRAKRLVEFVSKP